jgi:hypothetical protein
MGSSKASKTFDNFMAEATAKIYLKNGNVLSMTRTLFELVSADVHFGSRGQTI